MADENKCCGNHDPNNLENCCQNHNHDHDHDHEHTEMEVPTMTLTLDDDSELECYVLSVFDVEEKQYIALLPVGEEEVFLYVYNEDAEDGLSLDVIEDDNEYDKVAAVFETLFDSEDDEEEE